MAASMCRNVFQKLGTNSGILPQNSVTHIMFRCQNCLKALTITQTVRQCSQFAEKAKQMDGNTYRLKDDDRVYVREGQNPEELAELEQKEERKARRFIPPYMERAARRFNTRAFKARQYQWEGKASGIDPSIMWPTRKELEKMKAYEAEWCPTLQEMQKEIEEEQRMQRLEELKREKIIAANMAKMPRMLKEFDDNIEAQKRQEEEKKKKRAKMLEEARVKLGYNVDHRSHHFKVMLEEMEAAERKKKKEMKKKARMTKLGLSKVEKVEQ